MKIIEKINYQDYSAVFENLIQGSLAPLLYDRHKNRQKILEVCHLGKFLMFFNQELTINELCEKPDFILKFGNKRIGLEHQILIDDKPKEKEGFYENVFKAVEKELQMVEGLPNFLANCHLHNNLNFKLNKKKQLQQIVKEVLIEYVVNNNFIENPVIERIFKMPHSQITISPNLGAWWQQELSGDCLSYAIKKKEQKIEQYRFSKCDELWLLIVIGSTGESSYILPDNFDYKDTSEFDRIYILEDFNNKLFKL